MDQNSEDGLLIKMRYLIILPLKTTTLRLILSPPLSFDKPPPRERRNFSMSPLISVAVLGLGILVFFLISLNFHGLPKPLMKADEPSNPDSFIAERAREMLQEFNLIGPKVVGSVENEILAIEFLQRKFDEILAEMNPVHNLEFSRTTHSGSFEVTYNEQGMIEWYQNIQNVQIRLSPANGQRSGAALLVNTHFDTYPSSPGISDAGLMVVVMLETLRVLVKSNNSYRHDIVFLFNGAEEVGLKGSHAFITQHIWRHNITALINLDSTGAGGKEILFQAGPDAPWLAHMYARNVIYPYASAMGEELFQLNLIPSDTDFRIFRDYGGIKGLDLAHIDNGYVYHTKYDNFSNAPFGTYQHTGANVLALTRAMANSEELDLGVEHTESESIFFDYLSWFCISYNRVVSIIVNICIGLYMLKIAIPSIRSMAVDCDYPFSEALKEFVYMVLMQAGSAIIGVLLSALMSVIYDACGRSMSFFSNQWLVFGVYWLPFIFGLCIGPLVYFRVDPNTKMDRHYVLQMWMHANAILLTLVLFLLTFFGVRSAFIILIPVVLYGFTMTLNLVTGWQKKVHIWLPVMAFGQLFSFFYFSHLSLIALTTFIPMQGRGGPNSNPDLLICAFSFLMAWMMTGFITPIIGFMRRDLWVWSGIGVLIIATIIMIASPLGFPYTPETAPQRNFVFHTQRNFYDMEGNLKSSGNGYLMLPMDRHSHPDYLDMGLMADAEPIANWCDDELFCGVPLYRPRHLTQAPHGFWIPAQAPEFNVEPTFRQIINGQPANRTSFEMTGPSARLVYISPMEGIEIERWSFYDIVRDTELEFQGRKTYFIMYAAGNPVADTFWLDLNVPAGWTGKKLDVGIVSHYTHSPEEQTERFKLFVDSYPEWCHVTAWMARYDGYEV